MHSRYHAEVTSAASSQMGTCLAYIGRGLLMCCKMLIVDVRCGIGASFPRSTNVVRTCTADSLAAAMPKRMTECTHEASFR